MKTIAIRLTRHTTSDPLSVTYVKNDVGIIPVWAIDAPGTYRATFPCAIGFVPKQITTILGDTFQYLVVEGNGTKEFIINAMINDGTSLEAELTDYYLEIRVLDNVTVVSSTP